MGRVLGTWDEFLDSVLFAYRTTPIDGLDISPFKVIYGEPELTDTMEDCMDTMHEYQLSICEILQKVRRERFERNKRNHGAHKGIPTYTVGEKVYLNFPKGHFRPLEDPRSYHRWPRMSCAT
jgi:hypothetical protein